MLLAGYIPTPRQHQLTYLQLQDHDSTVIATARNPAASNGLQTLQAKYGKSRLHLVTLDVSRLESIQQAATEVGNILPNGLDYFISNAGKESDHFASWEKL